MGPHTHCVDRKRRLHALATACQTPTLGPIEPTRSKQQPASQEPTRSLINAQRLSRLDTDAPGRHLWPSSMWSGLGQSGLGRAECGVEGRAECGVEGRARPYRIAWDHPGLRATSVPFCFVARL